MKLKDLALSTRSASDKRRKRQLLIEPPATTTGPADSGETTRTVDACCAADALRCYQPSRQSDVAVQSARVKCQEASRADKVQASQDHHYHFLDHHHHNHQRQQQQQQHGRHNLAPTRTISEIPMRRQDRPAVSNKWSSGDSDSNDSLNGCACLSRQRGGRQDTQAMAARANKSTKRKSELTSFLAVLLGSLLAVALLLLVGQQVTCSSSSSSSALPVATPQRNTSSLLAIAPPKTTTAATTKTTTQATGTRAKGSSTLGPLIAGVAGVTSSVNGTSEATTPVAIAASASGDEASADEEESADADQLEAGDNNQGGGARSQLGDLLNESARDTADLLIERLQAGASDVPDPNSDSSDAGGAGASDQDGTGEEDVARPEVARATGNGTLLSAPRAERLIKIDGGKNSSGGGSIDASDEEFPADMDEATRGAMRVYAKWRATGDELIELLSRKLMPLVMEHGYDVDAGTVAGLLQVFNGIRQLRPWAVKLLDASFRLAPGVLVGTQSDFGDFDECLSIRVDDPSGLQAAATAPGDDESAAGTYASAAGQLDPLTGLKASTLVGRYCLADVEFPKPPRRRHRPDRRLQNISSILDEFEPIELRKPLLDFSQFPAFKDTIFVETGNFFHMLYVDPIRVGVCLTNKIDPLSFQQVINKLLAEFQITVDFRGRCVTKYERVVWTRYQVVSAYVLLAACSLVALSTLLDLLHSKLAKLPSSRGFSYGARVRLQMAAERYRPLFTSFSLIRNTRRLFRQPVAASAITSGCAGATAAAAAIDCAHLLGAKQRAASISAATATTSAASVSNGCATNSTSASSLADSSVESSPAIERRASSGAETLASSSVHDLISLQQQQQHFVSQQHLFSSPARRRATGVRADQVERAGAEAERHNAGVNLSSLHGIRVLTMTWMIVNHTYMFGGFFVLWAHRRLIDIAEWPKSLSFQMVLNGWLTVETYFFLSALIIVLSVLPLMRARKFSYAAYVLHRLVRLLPAYVGLVCLNFLWPLLSGGPVWLVKGKSFVQTPCEQNLWTNFLFINNWIWPEKQCMVHTWFLSADFQLYILAPIIVYLLYRRPALGHSLNLLVAVCASVLSGFVIYANELLPTTLINKLEFDSIKQQLSYSYFATYQHMGPYCLGILTGYLLHKRPQARLPKHLTWLLWLLLPPLSFTTLLLTYLWNGAYDDPSLINPSPLVSAFYVAIHRTIWTALVAWLVFACTTGRAKLLSNFLSHSLFLPISRLSYSIYLVHLPVIMFRSLNLRHTLEWTDQNILWEACGNFVVSLFMGFFLNVVFESPIINLENVLMRRNRRDTDALPYNAQLDKQRKQQIFHTQKLTLASSGCLAKQQVDSSTGHGEKHADIVDSSGFSTCHSQSECSAPSEAPSDECQLAITDKEQQSLTNRAKLVDNLSPKRKISLGSKQTLSVEQIFGKQTAAATTVANRKQKQQGDDADDGRRIAPSGEDCGDLAKQEVAASSLASTISSQELDRAASNSTLAKSQDDRPAAAVKRSGRPHRELSPGGGNANARHRNALMSLSRRPNMAGDFERARDITEQDNIYSMTDEYRHYAPAGYKQWRRAMNLGHGASSELAAGAHCSGTRPQQYATLARTSRAHRDPSLMASQYAHSARQRAHHRQHETDLQFDRYNHKRPPHSLMPPQQQFVQSHDNQLMTRHDYQSIALDSIGRQQLDLESRQEQQEVPPRSVRQQRRHQSRYNTLTGAGAHSWRAQLAAHDRAGAEGDFLSSWDASSAWLMNSGSSGSGNVGAGSSVLLIPRVDSSTLRRPQARASSLIGQQQQQLESLGSKIVEESAAEENSAL